MSRWIVVSLLFLSLLAVPLPGYAQDGSCTHNAVFAADVTVPDGTSYQPDESFVKIWRVKNAGTCEWSSGYSLNWTGGEKMGSVTSQVFGKPVPAGQMAEIAVELQAPTTVGPAVSWWKVKDDTGRFFGDDLYVKIEVVAPTPSATVTASPSITPPPTLTPTATPYPSIGRQVKPTGKIVHHEFYLTDGYVNLGNGAWPPENDATTIAGWLSPLYVWGGTDHDPNVEGNMMRVPTGAQATAGTAVGNAKFPSPFIELLSGDDVYLTVHNRGLYQQKQKAHDDCSLQLHGIPTQPQYSGFPPSGGGYQENLRFFWQEPWYLVLGADTKSRDERWNAMSTREQQALLAGNKALVKKNGLSSTGGIRSQFNHTSWPTGVGGLPEGASVEDETQFTYYFRAPRPGSYLYRFLTASPAVRFASHGAIIVHPQDFGPESKTAYATEAGIEYDREHTFILSEMDPRWNAMMESGEDQSIDGFGFAPAIRLINGRTFPTTVGPFAWNRPDGSPEYEPRYDTHVQVEPGERFLIRYLNAGTEVHSIDQQGWPMRIVGAQGVQFRESRETSTLTIASGENYDTITVADPVYGVNEDAGAPLADRQPWRQIWAIQEHGQSVFSTGRSYPGGMLTLIEVMGVVGTPEGMPTWLNPFPAQPELESLPGTRR